MSRLNRWPSLYRVDETGTVRSYKVQPGTSAEETLEAMRTLGFGESSVVALSASHGIAKAANRPVTREAVEQIVNDAVRTLFEHGLEPIYFRGMKKHRVLVKQRQQEPEELVLPWVHGGNVVKTLKP